MPEKWFWIGIDREGGIHWGVRRSMEAAQEATENFPILAYGVNRDLILGRRARLYEIWRDKQEALAWEEELRRRESARRTQAESSRSNGPREGTPAEEIKVAPEETQAEAED